MSIKPSADSPDMMERFYEVVWLYLATSVAATFTSLLLAKLSGIDFESLHTVQQTLMVLFFFPLFMPAFKRLQAALKKYIES